MTKVSFCVALLSLSQQIHSVFSACVARAFRVLLLIREREEKKNESGNNISVKNIHTNTSNTHLCLVSVAFDTSATRNHTTYKLVCHKCLQCSAVLQHIRFAKWCWRQQSKTQQSIHTTMLCTRRRFAHIYLFEAFYYAPSIHAT